MTHEITVLILQLGALLVAAALLGRLFERVFHLPRVLGELTAGIVVGPSLLGGIPIGVLGQQLFPLDHGGALPVSVELYGVAVLASVVLLFLSGLETDLPTFLRFSGVATAVGLGGVIVSFAIGALSAVWFLPSVSVLTDPGALFLGTLSTATSVGITARILSEKRKMSSPEGVTILAAAVLDDVIGIILVAIVVAVARGGSAGVDWARIGSIALRAFGFWIGSTLIGVLLAPYLVRGLERTGSLETIASVSLGLALLLAGIAETAGLALIIGSYVMGLSLSRTEVADEIREQLHGLYTYLVPVFFAVMGLMVDFSALRPILGFGIAFSLLGIAAKLIGCGLPALFSGFTLRGALRIGAGMLPRGEVSLIIAGIGLSSGAIGADLFGVAVMTLLISSVIAPPLLSSSFAGPSGYRRGDPSSAQSRQVKLELPSEAAAAFVRGRIVAAFRSEGYYVTRVDLNSNTYRMRQESVHMTLIQRGDTITVTTPEAHEQTVRLVLVEELVELKELIAGLEAGTTDRASARLVEEMFDD